MTSIKKRLVVPQPMVQWYNPRQLAKTGLQVAASSIFGTRADFRLIESVALTPDQELDERGFYDYSANR